MKDRIRQIQEAQHMSQQIFAEYLGIGAATLSSIYTGRTRPTLNIVESIKRKLPAINIEWLMFGTGKMFSDNVDGNQTAGAVDASRGAGNASQTPPHAVSGDLFSVGQVDNTDFADEGERLLSFESPSEGVSGPLQRSSGVVKGLQHPSVATSQAASGISRVAVQQRPAVAGRAPRHVTEIRVYYDDQTWESFTPSKSK